MSKTQYINTRLSSRQTSTEEDVVAALVEDKFTSAERVKLAQIEALADVTDAQNVTDAGALMLDGNQTVNDVITFLSFPITPSSAPTTDYQVANKKYVDDSISALPAKYTDEEAQDTVFGAIDNSTTIELLYNDVGNNAEFNVVSDSIEADVHLKSSFKVVSKTANYTAEYYDFIKCDTSSGGFTITLPTAVSNSGKQINIIKTDSSSNVITVDGNASETINGELTKTINFQWTSITLISDGSNWIWV